MTIQIVPVILAGGSGTRLWPLSRENYPKQFLKLIGNNSLFQETLARVKLISRVKESIIVTNESHYFICRDQIKEAQVEHVRLILEPCSKNTAPAIALAAQDIVKINGPNSLMLVLPADHLIGKPKAFATLMESAIDTAIKGYLVTFGIVPTLPKTGYGYIQAGNSLDNMSFAVRKFIEKPSQEKASAFLKAKNYFWNSGMFFFRAQEYLQELKKNTPLIYESCREAYFLSSPDTHYFRVDEESFMKCPSDSIDYAVMEKTKRAAVIPLQLPWSDLGCWASVADAGDSDEKNNVIRGNVIMRECEGCFLSSESDALVATIGVKDQIVVSTADAVLVADKAYAQEVKEIVDGLKNTNQALTTHHKRVTCAWGYYEKLVKSPDFHIRFLVINPGRSMFLITRPLLTVIQGEIEIKTNAYHKALTQGNSFRLKEKSQIVNQGKEVACIIEIILTKMCDHKLRILLQDQMSHIGEASSKSI